MSVVHVAVCRQSIDEGPNGSASSSVPYLKTVYSVLLPFVVAITPVGAMTRIVRVVAGVVGTVDEVSRHCRSGIPFAGWTSVAMLVGHCVINRSSLYLFGDKQRCIYSSGARSWALRGCYSVWADGVS